MISPSNEMFITNRFTKGRSYDHSKEVWWFLRFEHQTLIALSGTPNSMSYGNSLLQLSPTQRLLCHRCLQRACCVSWKSRPQVARSRKVNSRPDLNRQVSSKVSREAPHGAKLLLEVCLSTAEIHKLVLMPSSCVMLNPEFAGSPVVKHFIFSHSS